MRRLRCAHLDLVTHLLRGKLGEACLRLACCEALGAGEDFAGVAAWHKDFVSVERGRRRAKGGTRSSRLLGVGQGSADELLRLDDLRVLLPSVSLWSQSHEERTHRVKLETGKLLLERGEERLAERRVGLRREEAVEEAVLVELLRRKLLAKQKSPAQKL